MASPSGDAGYEIWTVAHLIDLLHGFKPDTVVLDVKFTFLAGNDAEGAFVSTMSHRSMTKESEAILDEANRRMEILLLKERQKTRG
jgi:hypothetical protein